MKSYTDLLNMVDGEEIGQFLTDHADSGPLADEIEDMQHKNQEVIHALEEAKAPGEKIELAKMMESQGSDVVLGLIRCIHEEGKYYVFPKWFVDWLFKITGPIIVEQLKDIEEMQRQQ